jgi:putative membrane protein
MTQLTTTIGRTVRRISILAIPLLVAASGTAAAHGGGSYGGGMMDGGWDLFGGAMGLWGLLWMGLLIAVPLYIVYALLNRGSGGNEEQSLSVLRERYARGELSDDEFERRRNQLERTR